jgi:hypothetical protein
VIRVIPTIVLSSFLNPKLQQMGDAIGIKSDNRVLDILLPGLDEEGPLQFSRYSGPRSVFIMDDKSVIGVSGNSSVSRYVRKNDDFGIVWSKNLRAYTVAVGKTFIAVLYPSRISILDLEGKEVDSIKFATHTIPRISDDLEAGPRVLPAHGSKIVFAYYSTKAMDTAVVVFDMQKRDIEDIYEDSWISSDGKYLVKQTIVDRVQNIHRVTVTSVETGTAVFDDLLPDELGLTDIQAGYMILNVACRVTMPRLWMILINLDTLGTASIPTDELTITNDGYVAVVPDSNRQYDAENNYWYAETIYDVVHVFKLSDIPHAQVPDMNGHTILLPTNEIQACCVEDGV